MTETPMRRTVAGAVAAALLAGTMLLPANNAAQPVYAYADQGDSAPQATALEASSNMAEGVLCEAPISWNKEDGSEGSSMNRHMSQKAELYLAGGTYHVRIQASSADIDKMLSDPTYQVDGEEKDMKTVSADGVAPRIFELEAASLDDPIMTGFTIQMGAKSAPVKAQLVVDAANAARINPEVSGGAWLSIPIAMLNQSDPTKSSMAAGFFDGNVLATRVENGYKVRLTYNSSSQLTFENLTYGPDAKSAAVVKSDASATVYELAINSLAETLDIGFTYTPAGMSQHTHHADLVFKTALAIPATAPTDNANDAAKTTEGETATTDAPADTTATDNVTTAQKQAISGKASISKAYKASAKTKKLAKAKTFKLSNKGKTATSFKKKSGNAKIQVAETGKVTIKKGLKKGKYTAKVVATAEATDAYKEATKAITLTIRVK